MMPFQQPEVYFRGCGYPCHVHGRSKLATLYLLYRPGEKKEYIQQSNTADEEQLEYLNDFL